MVLTNVVVCRVLESCCERVRSDWPVLVLLVLESGSKRSNGESISAIIWCTKMLRTFSVDTLISVYIFGPFSLGQ